MKTIVIKIVFKYCLRYQNKTYATVCRSHGPCILYCSISCILCMYYICICGRVCVCKRETTRKRHIFLLFFSLKRRVIYVYEPLHICFVFRVYAYECTRRSFIIIYCIFSPLIFRKLKCICIRMSEHHYIRARLAIVHCDMLCVVHEYKTINRDFFK